MVVSNIFYFHPENWGTDPIWRAFFSNGLKPPTRILFLIYLCNICLWIEVTVPMNHSKGSWVGAFFLQKWPDILEAFGSSGRESQRSMMTWPRKCRCWLPSSSPSLIYRSFTQPSSGAAQMMMNCWRKIVFIGSLGLWALYIQIPIEKVFRDDVWGMIFGPK